MPPAQRLTWLRTVSRILLVLTLVGIAVLSLSPSVPSGPEGGDKIGHVLAYFVLACLMVLSVRRATTRMGRLAGLVAAAIAYGLVMESLQLLVGRQFDLMDMAANTVGALSGAAVGAVVRRKAGAGPS